MTVLNDIISTMPDIQGAYPRWLAIASVSDPKNLAAGQTGSIIIAGVLHQRFHVI